MEFGVLGGGGHGRVSIVERMHRLTIDGRGVLIILHVTTTRSGRLIFGEVDHRRQGWARSTLHSGSTDSTTRVRWLYYVLLVRDVGVVGRRVCTCGVGRREIRDNWAQFGGTVNGGMGSCSMRRSTQLVIPPRRQWHVFDTTHRVRLRRNGVMRGIRVDGGVLLDPLACEGATGF